MENPDQPWRRDYASARQAMEILKVRPQTLYAYVSRGWIHSIPQKGQKDRLYLRADIDRVSKRSLARSGHGPAAASAMNWGEPILPTSITEITAQGPRYRGHLAADLVRSGASFESVAELLWTGQLQVQSPPWPVRKPPVELLSLAHTLASCQARGNLLEAFAMVVLMLGLRHASATEPMSQGRTLAAAREIMQAIAGCFGFEGGLCNYRPMGRGESLVNGLLRAMAIAPTTENSTALTAMLILMADHELPPGTLSARVVASAGGTLHSCIASALCATSGSDVGRMYERVETFLGHSQTRAVLVKRARRLHAQGRGVPGFDHPLYPQGDPRALQLLDIALHRQAVRPELHAVLSFIDEMRASTGLMPRQELAMVVLARAMGLPRQACAALFVLGRTAGWVAHVQEQRAAGNLLRPRAKFVGPARPVA